MKITTLSLLILTITACGKVRDHVEFQIPTEPAQIVINPPAVNINVTPNITITTGDTNVTVSPTIDNSNSNTSTGGSVGNVSATNGDVVGTVSGGNNTATGGNGGAGGSSTSTAAGGTSSNTNTSNITSGNSTSTGGTGGGASAGNSTSNANNSGSNTTSNSGSVSNSGSQSATGGTSSNNNNNSSDTSSSSNSGGNTVSGQVNATNSGLINNNGSGGGSEKESDDKKQDDKGKKEKKAKKSAGLTCKVYNLSSTQPSNLPNFSNLTPVSTIIIDQLDVSDVDYAGSFPKFPLALKGMLEWYGLVCDGTIKVPKTTTYTFFLTSDDGSKFYIDGSLLINNDGLHSTRAYQNNTTLTKGNHDIHVEYFQGPRTRISLVLEWSSSDFARQVLGSSFLKH